MFVFKKLSVNILLTPFCSVFFPPTFCHLHNFPKKRTLEHSFIFRYLQPPQTEHYSTLQYTTPTTTIYHHIQLIPSTFNYLTPPDNYAIL